MDVTWFGWLLLAVAILVLFGVFKVGGGHRKFIIGYGCGIVGLIILLGRYTPFT